VVLSGLNSSSKAPGRRFGNAMPPRQKPTAILSQLSSTAALSSGVWAAAQVAPTGGWGTDSYKWRFAGIATLLSMRSVPLAVALGLDVRSAGGPLRGFADQSLPLGIRDGDLLCGG
jgi:hypothetical protein